MHFRIPALSELREAIGSLEHARDTRAVWAHPRSTQQSAPWPQGANQGAWSSLTFLQDKLCSSVPKTCSAHRGSGIKTRGPGIVSWFVPGPRLGARTPDTCMPGREHAVKVLSPTAAQPHHRVQGPQAPVRQAMDTWPTSCHPLQPRTGCPALKDSTGGSLIAASHRARGREESGGSPPSEDTSGSPGAGASSGCLVAGALTPRPQSPPWPACAAPGKCEMTPNMQAPRERRPLCRARGRSATAQSTATGQQDRPQSCDALRAAALVPGGREPGVQEGLPGCLVRGRGQVPGSAGAAHPGPGAARTWAAAPGRLVQSQHF